MRKMVKNNVNNAGIPDLLDATISVRNLLILQMYRSNTPLREIVKATGISSRDIYKIVTKKDKKLDHTKVQNE